MWTIIPTKDEVRAAVFAMNGSGSPGLYGFSGGFYQFFWDIVGDDVFNSVLHFFLHIWILPGLISNSIALIPKFPEAEKIGYYRPIALANY